MEHDDEIKIKYLDVVKMNCINKEIKLWRKALDTIIEACIDYADIVESKVDQQETDYRKAVCKCKVEELRRIASELTEKVGYNKSCGITKDIDDVGMDAFAIMGRRNRDKGKPDK